MGAGGSSPGLTLPPFAYVADGNTGITVVNISDPIAPELVGKPLDGVERGAGGQDGQCPQQSLMVLGQQVVRPLHRGAQSSVASLPRGPTVSEDVQALVEAGHEVVEPECGDPPGGQFEGQWEAVEGA